ncbi:MAG: hypothetical protein RJA96_193 [Actinomycetota bacterium]|jgi:uncharacterized repeat protein (TIGR02543 family)
MATALRTQLFRIKDFIFRLTIITLVLQFMPFHFEVSEATSGSVWIQNLGTTKAQIGNYLTFSPGIEVRQKAFNFEIIFTPYGNATNFKGGGLLGSSDWDAGSQALTFVTDKKVALADGFATTELTFAQGLQFGQQNHFAFECNEAAVCAAFLNGVRNTEGASRFNGQKANIDRPLRGLMDQIGGTSNQTAWSQVTPADPRLNWAEGVKIFAARIVTVNWLNNGSGATALYATSGGLTNPFPQYINGASANSPSVLTSLSDVSGTQFLMSVGSGGITDSKSAGRTFTLGQSTTGNVTVQLPLTAQTVSFTSSAPSNLAVGSTYTPTTSSTSGLTPVVSVDSSSSAICSVSAGVVSAIGVGTCTLNLNQAGDSTHASAPQVQQSFTTRAAIAISGATISGTTNFGQVLTANAATVTNASSYTTSYQWRRDGTAISGAINSTYTLTSADVGTAISVIITVSDGSTSASATSTATPTVGKATPTFSSWSNVPKVYGDSPFPVTAPTVTGSLAGSFTYSSANTAVISVSGSTLSVVGAGTSVITATFTPTESTNYNSATTTMTVTVSRPTLSVTASSHTVAYGGAIPTITPTISGYVNGEDASVVTGLSCSTTYTTTTAVGTTGSSCTGATASNYLFTYTSGVITITESGQITPLAISSTSVTYGSALSLTTSGGSGSGATSFRVDSGPCTVSLSTLTPTAAGTCMVTATKAADGNYLAASSASTAITVNPKGLTVSGLTGVNKEYDGTRAGAAMGTPTLVGVVGSDNVLLGGTPTFTFATANAGDRVSLVASGYTLSESSASNYTLTQPTLTANITQKAARVAANNVTIAFGGTITSGVTASGLISPDAVGSASYTYTGTGTSTPPTAVGTYTVTPSSAVFSRGLSGNYSITYDTATVTILAKYTITYNANGGFLTSNSTATTVDYVVGDPALTLPTPTRANYTFIGWYTLQTNGVQVTGAYTPTANVTLWARWIQNSLYGMGTNTKVLTITTLSGVGNTYSANAGGGTIAIEYLADALPAGTVIDAYVLSDTSTATSIIGSGNDYVMSLVLAWVATDGTVPTTATGKAISMTITNSSIKRGAKIYSVIGNSHTLLGTATADGSATILITDDPQIIIAITKPDAPTGVSATSGGNASTTVSWTAPSDGGSPITSYTATSNAGQTCTSATTSCSVTGLTNGTPYTFTVTATNSIGTSDPSSASSPITPAAPVATPPSSGGGGGGSTYVQPAPEPTPTIDPAIAAAAAAAAAAKALADAKAAEEKAAAEAKALAEKKAAEEAELLAQIKALQDKADADALAAAQKLQEELAAAQLKAEEEQKALAAFKLAEEQRIAAERAAAAKKITTVYSTSAAFKLNATYTKRLSTYTKKIAAGSQVTCIGYAKSSKTVSYAKAKTVAANQAKALCTSMKKINPTLVTKSIVYPASKAPVTTVNKKWIPVSYRVETAVN